MLGNEVFSEDNVAFIQDQSAYWTFDTNPSRNIELLSHLDVGWIVF